LYAFERFLDEILAGRDATLKLRAGDEFKHLEEISIQIKEQLLQLKDKTMKDVAHLEDNKIISDTDEL
jgi:signal peptidase II